MKQAIFFIITVLSIASCKKDVDNRRYSTWYVNGEKFSANNVDVTATSGATAWECDDEKGSFYFMFVTHGVLEPGKLTNGYSGQSKCNFHANDNYYEMKDGEFTYALGNGEWRAFDLDTTWFYNYHNPNDSVLIWGTFREP